MLDEKRWIQFSFPQQIGHIGSEISRARHWEEKKEEGNQEAALIRVLELIDLTITVQKTNGRLKEILRLRECICDKMIKSFQYDVPLKDLQSYCEVFYLSHHS